ncbi:MAG: ATP-dependent endonuclease [Candidatus Gastranaerophilales bacterium]|nr:ATP-dependent endonuclease [Candidatus Gastranaerophilales bacterium]
MKFKKLTKEQIIISIDRLTRFKPTKEKYIRVFTDILTSALIEPKIKKSDIAKMDLSKITEMVCDIFNASFEISSDNTINNKLKEFENNVFINDTETQKLLNNNINYTEALKLIEEDCPVNLKWLKSLKDNNQLENRKNHFLKYPLEKIILVEGITEEILLPAFSKFLGHDFYAEGIQIIAAGGKNQVVKMYYKLSQEVKLPIFVLLDRDAEDNIRQIEPRLREHDRIHLVSCGEFEDLLPKSLIIKTVNAHFKNFLAINEHDLSEELPTAKILENIFKTRGLHEFKKAEFAKLVREKIAENTDISEEIALIIKEINFTNKSLDSKFCS